MLLFTHSVSLKFKKKYFVVLFCLLRIDVDKGWRPRASEADCDHSQVQVGISLTSQHRHSHRWDVGNFSLAHWTNGPYACI